MLALAALLVSPTLACKKNTNNGPPHEDKCPAALNLEQSPEDESCRCVEGYEVLKDKDMMTDGCVKKCADGETRNAEGTCEKTKNVFQKGADMVKEHPMITSAATGATAEMLAELAGSKGMGKTAMALRAAGVVGAGAVSGAASDSEGLGGKVVEGLKGAALGAGGMVGTKATTFLAQKAYETVRGQHADEEEGIIQ